MEKPYEDVWDSPAYGPFELNYQVKDAETLQDAVRDHSERHGLDYTNYISGVDVGFCNVEDREDRVFVSDSGEVFSAVLADFSGLNRFESLAYHDKLLNQRLTPLVSRANKVVDVAEWVEELGSYVLDLDFIVERLEEGPLVDKERFKKDFRNRYGEAAEEVPERLFGKIGEADCYGDVLGCSVEDLRDAIVLEEGSRRPVAESESLKLDFEAGTRERSVSEFDEELEEVYRTVVLKNVKRLLGREVF